MIAMFLILVSIAAAVEAKTACYDIGCVTNDPPYQSLQRPISQFPLTPEEINTTFFLYTRKNPNTYQVLSARNLSTISESHFDGRLKTLLFIHGFTDTGHDYWVVESCKRMLQQEDVNCICVDWSGGSKGLYTIAVNNIQIVGAEVAFFINKTMEHFNASLSNILIIGQSLGAQAAGEAGKRRKGINLIFALDPAGPYFAGTPPEVCIDPTDAKCVIVIHTNGGILGIKSPVGHVDYYPNGGEHQPGCFGKIFNISNILNLTSALIDDLALCDHVSSYHLFLDAITNPGGFMGYCASDYESFKRGEGFPCNQSCSVMGYYSRPCSSSCRSYYLITGPRYDYARWRFHVTVHISGDLFLGSLLVSLCNQSSVCSKNQTIYSGQITSGSKYSAFIDLEVPPPVVEARFFWKRDPLSSLLGKHLRASSVVAQSGIDGAVFKFCDNKMSEQENPQTLPPCQ